MKKRRYAPEEDQRILEAVDAAPENGVRAALRAVASELGRSFQSIERRYYDEVRRSRLPHGLHERHREDYWAARRFFRPGSAVDVEAVVRFVLANEALAAADVGSVQWDRAMRHRRDAAASLKGGKRAVVGKKEARRAAAEAVGGPASKWAGRIPALREVT